MSAALAATACSSKTRAVRDPALERDAVLAKTQMPADVATVLTACPHEGVVPVHFDNFGEPGLSSPAAALDRLLADLYPHLDARAFERSEASAGDRVRFLHRSDAAVDAAIDVRRLPGRRDWIASVWAICDDLLSPQ